MDVLHTAMQVTDIEESSAFYEELLGLEKTREFEIDGQLNYIVGGSGPAELQLQVVDGPVDPDGIDHVAIAADDVEALVEEAVSEWDSDVVVEPQAIGEDAKIAFITDPDGYAVELIEEL